MAVVAYKSKPHNWTKLKRLAQPLSIVFKENHCGYANELNIQLRYVEIVWPLYVLYERLGRTRQESLTVLSTLFVNFRGF